jgi:hypothetical protein
MTSKPRTGVPPSTHPSTTTNIIPAARIPGWMRPERPRCPRPIGSLRSTRRGAHSDATAAPQRLA